MTQRVFKSILFHLKHVTAVMAYWALSAAKTPPALNPVPVYNTACLNMVLHRISSPIGQLRQMNISHLWRVSERACLSFLVS